MKKIILLLALSLIHFLGHAQYIYTIAGNGTYGYSGDNGPATSADLTSNGVTLDSEGNIYIVESANSNRIRKVNASTGIITTVNFGSFLPYLPTTLDDITISGGSMYAAGRNCVRRFDFSPGVANPYNSYFTAGLMGNPGYSGDNGFATNAKLGDQLKIVFAGGFLYITDTNNRRIRKVDLTSSSSGIITTIAGNGGIAYNGDNIPATSASINPVGKVAVDSDGNVYFADHSNHRIRKITASTGMITTVAGNGIYGYYSQQSGVLATLTELRYPVGVVFDNVGNIYFSDDHQFVGGQLTNGFYVRKVNLTTGIITFINSSNGFFGDNGFAINAAIEPIEIAADALGNIYISSSSYYAVPTAGRIRKVTNPATTPTTTIAQSFCQGQVVTVANLVATGTALKWYNVPIGGSPLASSTVLQPLVYYVSQTVGGIESARAPVTVTFQPMITPDFTTIAPVCSGTTASPLSTTSTNNITGTWSPAWNNLTTTTYTFTPTAGTCATTTSTTVTITGPTIIPTFATIAPVCKNTTLSPLPTTSNNGIVGSWSPSLNNTATTMYTFTPTPIVGQCLTTNTLTVVINQPINPVFTQVATVCSGTTLSPLPTTSNNGVTGTWSPALDNMTATTTYYNFTPDAGQCANYGSMGITITPPTITPTFASGSIPSSICEGATLLPLPTTSTNGIVGTWDPPLNNYIGTTMYTFIPAPDQCAKTRVRSITVKPYIIPTFAGVGPTCSGTTLSPLPTTSNESISGSWTPPLNNLATTTYTFTPTPITGQCSLTNTLTIEINNATIPTGSSIQNFTQGNTLSNIIVNPSNVVWYPTYVNALNNTYPLSPATLLVNGATYYAVNVVGDCRSDVFAVTVNAALGINENSLKDFAIYPNPVNTILTLQHPDNITFDKIVVTDLTGKIILQTQNTTKINVGDFASGIYIIEVNTGDKKFQSKFVKE